MCKYQQKIPISSMEGRAIVNGSWGCWFWGNLSIFGLNSTLCYCWWCMREVMISDSFFLLLIPWKSSANSHSFMLHRPSLSLELGSSHFKQCSVCVCVLVKQIFNFSWIFYSSVIIVKAKVFSSILGSLKPILACVSLPFIHVYFSTMNSYCLSHCDCEHVGGLELI